MMEQSNGLLFLLMRRIPFVLGTLEDGTPAVFMDTAYIKNAVLPVQRLVS